MALKLKLRPLEECGTLRQTVDGGWAAKSLTGVNAFFTTQKAAEAWLQDMARLYDG